jgi:CheY-like chemotaxis protein
MAELLHRTLGEAVRVETALAEGLWRTHTDRSQLENAILNLAVNARDAMADGGLLTIATLNCQFDAAFAARHPGIPPGEYVLIEVADTGAGMTPEVAAKAFDPFFTTKPVGRGTGLGLSQVYGFVRQSGGHVRIHSEPGEGTAVKLYLPRFRGQAEESGAPGPAVARPLPLGDRQEFILVVEDEERVRQFTVEALRELGYTVFHARNATTALRQLDANPAIALLFTDIVMPDVNGRRLADEALRRNPGLKVLYTSGFLGDAAVQDSVLEAGAHLLTKPFTLEQLATRVRAALGEQAVQETASPR